MIWRLKLLRFAQAIDDTARLAAFRLIFGFFRLLGPERASDFGGWLTRRIGALLPVQRICLANLRAAFPDKSEAEIKTIANGAWDNLGRTGAEYAHLDRLFEFDGAAAAGGSRVEIVGVEHFLALRDDGKPGLVFAAHLANWELPAIGARQYDLEVTALFRAPNSAAANRVVAEMRKSTMGGLQISRSGAAIALHGVLERGGHVGIMVDQHFGRGVPVEFFGRAAMANPTFALLARNFDCPVHGVRVIRLPDHRFRLELTPPLDLPRNGQGDIIIKDAMQMITSVVEGWVREYPEQWLWMHRRWR